MKIDDNPFERWGLDPRDDGERMTRAMRKRSRQLSTEEREELQRQWRELTGDKKMRAHWVALTPPPLTRCENPWELARQLVETPPCPDLPPLRPNLEDCLVLPRLREDQLYAAPPFLPDLLTAAERRRLDPRGGSSREEVEAEVEADAEEEETE